MPCQSLYAHPATPNLIVPDTDSKLSNGQMAPKILFRALCGPTVKTLAAACTPIREQSQNREQVSLEKSPSGPINILSSAPRALQREIVFSGQANPERRATAQDKRNQNSRSRERDLALPYKDAALSPTCCLEKESAFAHSGLACPARDLCPESTRSQAPSGAPSATLYNERLVFHVQREPR